MTRSCRLLPVVSPSFRSVVHLESKFVTPSALQCGLSLLEMPGDGPSEQSPGRGQHQPPTSTHSRLTPRAWRSEVLWTGCPRNGACARGTTGWPGFTSSHFCFTCGDLAKGQVTKREGRTYKETPESDGVSLSPQALPLCTWLLCIPWLFHEVLMARVRWHFPALPETPLCWGNRVTANRHGSTSHARPTCICPHNPSRGLSSGFLTVPS